MHATSLKGNIMPALQVKDCPTDVYERLRACAAEENRSISQQALTIIKRYVEERYSSNTNGHESSTDARKLYASSFDETDYLGKRKKALERICALPPLPITTVSPSAAELLRQIREEEAR